MLNLVRVNAKKLRLMNNKGQTLVEFAILIPVIMMVFFVIIDFANVFYQKNYLENVTNDVVRYKEHGKSDDYIKNKTDKDIDISFKPDGEYKKIIVTKKVNLVTPFSNVFFSNPFIIKSERVVFNE